MSRITILDTTLRDGEQSPGVSLNLHEKLQIAHQLARLGVDVIEAGFPIASPGDFNAVKAVADEVKGVGIQALARTLEKDIDRAAEAVKGAEKPMIHVFLATSEIHRRHKLKKAKEEILRLATRAVRYAKGFTDDVEFSPEDASRTEPEFLREVVEAVIDAGATVVNIPDTVGYAVPEEFARLIEYLIKEVRNVSKAAISVHCHNDLGLAVANSLAAIKAGAAQVECTLNGIGERAGNAALEEIVMALNTRKDFYNYTTGIVTQEIMTTSRLVSSLTGLRVQRNKAIVGENAFAHSSGVHQDGIIKERTTYEIMRPEDIGRGKTRLPLGKLSGRNAFMQRIKELGYGHLDKNELEEAFNEFKVLGDRKKNIHDEDIEALVINILEESPPVFRLESMRIDCGPGTTPLAEVRLRMRDDHIEEYATMGDGPIDALFKAIDLITDIPGRLLDYQVRAITSGKDAMGEVSVEVDFNGEVQRGRVVSCDIIEASARAYLNAVNKIAQKTARQIPEKKEKTKQKERV
ncbi:MAG: 2-isopropylmalate synthase [Planctomycetes bacterium GWA2_50_13]|nr:MAG: 2-isopropylmalate synthase [Planctomycetes bacterium GWA2_50_13]OHB92471.1 MAG: 2-isopropylmalate synthase [Planctomycetes bacterium RIFCSPHIGHO2_12_FULL_51_37]OHB94836.1 MAG: 2-isopropylmalate synthase [Planctomycetes bacterium RIFCSPLOWO2_02_FULL_50_16]